MKKLFSVFVVTCLLWASPNFCENTSPNTSSFKKLCSVLKKDQLRRLDYIILLHDTEDMLKNHVGLKGSEFRRVVFRIGLSSLASIMSDINKKHISENELPDYYYEKIAELILYAKQRITFYRTFPFKGWGGTTGLFGWRTAKIHKRFGDVVTLANNDTIVGQRLRKNSQFGEFLDKVEKLLVAKKIGPALMDADELDVTPLLRELLTISGGAGSSAAAEARVDGALSEGTGDSAAAQKDKKIGELNTLRGVPLISFLLRFKRSRYFSKTLSRVALYGLRYHIARTKTLMQRDAGMVRIMVSEIAARVKKEMSWKPWNPIDWKDKLLYYDLFRTCDETLRKMGSSAGDLRDQLTEYKTSAAKFSNLGAGKQPVIALYKIRHLINNKRRYDEPKKEAFVIGINELEKLLKTTNKYADALKGEGKEEVHKDSFFHYLEKSFNETIARVGWKWWHISGWKDKGLRVPIKGIFSEARSGGLYEIYNEDLKKTVDEYNNPGHSIWSDLSRATAFESAGWPTQKQIEDGTDSHDSTVGDYSWENKNTPTSTQQSEIPTMKDGEDEQPQGTRTPTRSDGESMVPM